MSEERDELVVLMDEDGQETEFEFLDTVEMKEKEYVVLLPVQEEEVAPAEEVLILRVDQDENGEDVFSSIEDDNELNEVFEQFKTQAEDEFEFTEQNEKCIKKLHLKWVQFFYYCMPIYWNQMTIITSLRHMMTSRDILPCDSVTMDDKITNFRMSIVEKEYWV